jgi:cleavage stimulation factor subunit 2
MSATSAAAANTSQQASRVVFVGNIPWDKSESDLIEIFSTIGPILAFRLLYDRDTGKSRGYGFCEFEDSEMASSAIRNLNGFEVSGRTLKVDYAENDQMPSALAANTPSGTGSGQQQHQQQHQQLHQTQKFLHQGIGKQVGPLNIPPLLQYVSQETPSTETITKILATLSTAQLYEILVQLKVLFIIHTLFTVMMMMIMGMIHHRPFIQFIYVVSL